MPPEMYAVQIHIPLCVVQLAKIDVVDYCNQKFNSRCSKVWAVQKSCHCSNTTFQGELFSASRDPCQFSHIILVLLHLLVRSQKIFIGYSYKSDWLKVSSLGHYQVRVNWIFRSSVMFIHTYLIDFCLKCNNCNLLLKCTKSCVEYFWCILKCVGGNTYFMFSLTLGQIVVSFPILLNVRQYFKLKYGNIGHVLADNARNSKHKKAESWKSGSAAKKRGWTTRRGDAVLETSLVALEEGNSW